MDLQIIVIAGAYRFVYIVNLLEIQGRDQEWNELFFLWIEQIYYVVSWHLYLWILCQETIYTVDSEMDMHGYI